MARNYKLAGIHGSQSLLGGSLRIQAKVHKVNAPKNYCAKLRDTMGSWKIYLG